jgi:hypothetical protein
VEVFAEENSRVSEGVVGLREATFSWSNETDGSLTPSRRSFTLKIEGELMFKQGCVNLIIGPTGSGKTSLLMALLGWLHCFFHVCISLDDGFQVKCILYRRGLVLGSIFREKAAWRMQHRNHGSRTRQSGSGVRFLPEHYVDSRPAGKHCIWSTVR